MPSLVVLPEASSTNTELARMASAGGVRAFTTVVTDHQTAGRGRLDRSWTAPAGTSLAISVLVPSVGAGRAGWLPLAAGLAMAEAVSALLPERPVGVKWPNDVLVGDRKVSGVLAELLPSGEVVLGAGLNVGMTAEELPVATATSLAIEGPDGAADADAALATYLLRLRHWVQGYLDAGGDARASGLHAALTSRCTTLGRSVRVELPQGSLEGTATGIAPDGRLEVASQGRLVAVAAGDVVHVR